MRPQRGEQEQYCKGNSVLLVLWSEPPHTWYEGKAFVVAMRWSGHRFYLLGTVHSHVLGRSHWSDLRGSTGSTQDPSFFE